MSDKVTATVVAGNNAPADDGPGDAAWRATAHPYTVTLHYQGRSMTLPFWTGSGWTTAPTAADVMDSVCSEASLVVNASSFDEYAAELGTDTDSRRAERDYRATVEQTDKLRALLGDDFDGFVFAENDEMRARCAS